jgi:streptomycin 6-kinase
VSLLPFDLPAGLLADGGRDEAWGRWLAGLPRLVRDVLDEWALAVDGTPVHGHTALVVPVLAEGRPAVLKIVWPHDEALHEALALQHWHGRGAVRLLRADPRRAALLLERLSTEDLTGAWDVEACEVVGGLYGLLHVPAPPQLAHLSTYVERWTDELVGFGRTGVLPRRIVEQSVHLGRAFATDPSTNGVMVHGDLHYGKVLAGERQPWLAIAPQPVSGDPHYEVAPLLGTRWDEVVASGDVRGTVRRRFHAVVDAAGLDEQRARDWVIVRETHATMWAAGEDGDRASVAVAVVKAVQE